MSLALQGISKRLDSKRLRSAPWTRPTERSILSVMNETARSTGFPKVALSIRGTVANDAAASDSYVERAKEAMRADPGRRWTVAALARTAGLSRAPFARRFRRATGKSPGRWLTELRLELARRRLVETDDGLLTIAVEIGYSSDFAFSKAFKRLFGIAPGSFRRFGVAPTFRAAA